MCLISINISQQVFAMFLYDSRSGSNPLSTIQVSRRHELGLAAAQLAAEAIAQDMGESYQLDCEWANEDETELRFRGSGVQGLLTLDEDSLHLEVHLGLMLLPVRSVLEQEILDYVKHRLPCPKSV
ncbi:polyhydroxyalkanoic acid system family protein [Aeromonas enteropelogenes]|uniref:polyhydroxyalkanoic acid system family protein n=1 Tax=Aeromonas enteropelogenes TaxID=29489 RepID=UPI0038D0C66C